MRSELLSRKITPFGGRWFANPLRSKPSAFRRDFLVRFGFATRDVRRWSAPFAKREPLVSLAEARNSIHRPAQHSAMLRVLSGTRTPYCRERGCAGGRVVSRFFPTAERSGRNG